jgi:hypothetical protein
MFGIPFKYYEGPRKSGEIGTKWNMSASDLF